MTIVGTKHYDRESHDRATRAFERIAQASQRPLEEQRLFLVQDVHNKFDADAVMFHDGVRKLGYVAKAEAGPIRKALDDLALEHGRDQVFVVTLAPIDNVNAFKWGSSFAVSGVGFVYERVARKHAAACEQEAQRGS